MNIKNYGSHCNTEFSVRIVVCDHYLAKPIPGIDVIYSDFRGSDIKQVPVLRIFGPTPDGHKACLHVHGVFPYFYIPCPTPNPEPQYMYQIAASLDKALNIALKQATSANQHVYKISLVKGLPFYGYHDKEHLYLKIFLYSPGLIKQAVELCSNGAILGQALQPHESHLNFTLQFFIDFNLFGMSNIDLQTVQFRKSTLLQSSNDLLESPNEQGLKPESSCYYEADGVASHIINRQRVGKGDGIENPGLEEVWNQEIERRKQLNISLASKSLSQTRINDETESHYKHQQIFMLKMSNLIDKPVATEQGASKIEHVYYPAESLEGSQLFDAVDVSVHVPATVRANETRREFDETLVGDMDDTIVDENVALNCSLHHSQVLLNSEDLELLDILQDMDEKPVEDDSVLGTPANDEQDADDEIEYSQVYNDDTVYLNDQESKDGASEDMEVWNDSFWEGANIPQLDGTFDDDHVKKVRKRKMRPLRLGLSKTPKPKKDETVKSEAEKSSALDISEIDEINASRETIDDISSHHLRRTNKVEQNADTVEQSNDIKPDIENISIIDLVDKVSKRRVSIGTAEAYDIKNEFQPTAGPSVANNVNISKIINANDTDSSQENDNSGIISFYTSKLFDMSVDNVDNKLNESNHVNETNIKKENCESIDEVMNENHESSDEKFNEIKPIPTLKDCEIKCTKILTPKIRPPTKSYILNTLDLYNIPKVGSITPYYSDHKDVGDKVEIGQMLLKIQSKSFKDQKPLEKVLDTTSLEEWRQLVFLQNNEMSQEPKPDALRTLLAGNKNCILEPVKRPPTTKQVKQWIANKEKSTNNEVVIKDNDISKNLEELDNSQALGLNEDVIDSSISLETDEKEKTTLDNSLQVTMQPDGSFLCFGSSNQKEISSMDTAFVDANFLTIMLVEVQTSIRGELHPDPALDAIQAIFIQITNDCPPNHFLPKSITQIFVVDNNTQPKYLERCVFGYNVTYVENEDQILEKVIELVKQHDPDIMCGYEIEKGSWGYILERSQVLGKEMVREISRITEKYRQKKFREENDFEGRIIGRVMFNVWRLFRHELALSSYSFECCMYEILKERVPLYSYAQLAEWWGDASRTMRWVPVEYHITRLSGTVRMLEKLDIINRTSELARLFGLQWWEVLSRGSQFRVESLMLRAARPLNLVALSPSVSQRAAMKAPECLPLIFEPESRFYSDPMIVLDFQSLYPSMMIAYNYCFSTCIGRVQNISGDTAYEFGAWRLRIPKAKLEALVHNGLVHWSPVGVGFVKPSVRRGVLPSLLRRILAARQAVKKNMKLQTDESVKRAMHSRQLGLKLIANVTYGYTAANFSGRMPCVEVADSVVAKGRETLERAIRTVINNTRWNAKVVYGDTDSMFVLVPGRSRKEAFEIGQEIADAVTADNPSPVALKLEKVYQPCILQTKKRYVGYMYENADQEKPVYEAKGIETVRRDGCPAGVKVLQRSLCTLFESGDMSRVKRIVCDVLSRLMDGRMPLQDLVFTREYHGPRGYRPGASAPPNEIANRMRSLDPRAAPPAGARVRWAVRAGGGALLRLCVAPREWARAPPPPHVDYYATRVLLPPLHRCLSLLGADVFKWWRELGYKRESSVRAARGGIARFMSRERCVSCGARGPPLCRACGGHTALLARTNCTETYLRYCHRICSSCCGHTETTKCENTECPIFWRHLEAKQKYMQIQEITQLPSNTRQIIDF